MWKVKLNLNIKNFKKSKLLVKYIAKILFGWDNEIFEDKRNQARQRKSWTKFLERKNFKKRSNIKVVLLDLGLFSFLNMCDYHTGHSHRSYKVLE